MVHFIHRYLLHLKKKKVYFYNVIIAGLESYWKVLLEGKDCIGELPQDRWSLEDYYDSTPRAGKAYSKYGGFIGKNMLACF